jgi:hypothetical protein
MELEGANDMFGRFEIAENTRTVAPVKFDKDTPSLVAFESAADTLGNRQIPFHSQLFRKIVRQAVGRPPHAPVFRPYLHYVKGNGIGKAERDEVKSALFAPMRQITVMALYVRNHFGSTLSASL